MTSALPIRMLLADVTNHIFCLADFGYGLRILPLNFLWASLQIYHLCKNGQWTIRQVALAQSVVLSLVSHIYFSILPTVVKRCVLIVLMSPARPQFTEII